MVVIVDQFEEVFTLCDDQQARRAFIANLLVLTRATGLRHTVILTMRSDFETYVAQLPALQQVFEHTQVRVPPLNAAELRDAVVRPAELVGLRFEDGIIDALLQDMLGEPAALPLLQFTLLRLWELRERTWVTWEAYERLGGGRRALARSADAFYEGLIPEEQVTARRLLLRMVRPGEGLEVMSSRVRRESLYQASEARERIERVLTKLSRARLIRVTAGDTSTDAQVEVAHEALVRNWPRLVGWLEEERAAIAVRRRLEAKAAEWVRLGRGASGLLDAVQLGEAERWLAGADAAYLGYNEELPSLVQASRAALEEARAAETAHQIELARAQTQAEVARQRADEQASATRRAGQFAFVLLALLALTRRNAVEARVLALAAGAQAALSKDNTDLALALALAANSQGHALMQAELTLSDAAYAPGTRRVLAGHTRPVQSVAISPDGKTALSGASDKTMLLWDLTSGQIIRRLEGHSDEVQSVAFSPDGKTALSGSWDKMLVLWDVASGQLIHRFEGHADKVNAAVFSPDGKTALSGSTDKTLLLWDVASGQIIRRFEGHSGEVQSVVFSPDGKTALSGSTDKTLLLWDVASGQIIRRFEGHAGGVLSVAFSPDGKTALSGSEDPDRDILWDLGTGTLIHRFRGHTNRISSVAFSPDGARLSPARVTRACAYGISPRAISSTRSSDTATPSRPSPSVRMDTRSSRDRPTPRCGCGTCPAARKFASSKAIATACGAPFSAPMGVPHSPARQTGRSSYGMWRLVRPSGTSRATQVAYMARHSAPMDGRSYPAHRIRR